MFSYLSFQLNMFIYFLYYAIFIYISFVFIPCDMVRAINKHDLKEFYYKFT